MSSRLLAVASAALVACTIGCGEDPVTVVEGSGGAGGEGGSAAPLPPGLAPCDCPPGSFATTDGGCQEAGVPPEGCGPYHASDGQRSCTPVLPPVACDPGEMALPGESACRPIVDCSVPPPSEAGAVHVDASYGGNDSDGTLARPWTSLQAAADAASAGDLVLVAPGSYESVAVRKRLRIWGTCPDDVQIDAVAAPGIVFEGGASGSELHRMGVTSDVAGIGVVLAQDVVIDGVWVHDVDGVGIDALGSGGVRAGVTVRSALVESNALGLVADTADVTMENCVVRNGRTLNGVEAGHGLLIANDSDATIERCLVRNNRRAGIFAENARATVRDSVVLDTDFESDSGFAHGIGAFTVTPTAPRASVTAERVIVQGSRGQGLYALDADLHIEHVVVRDHPAPTRFETGEGISVLSASAPPTPMASLTARASTIEDVWYAGITGIPATIDLQGVIVRRVGAGSEDDQGRGLSFEITTTSQEAGLVTLDGVRVEQVREVGVLVANNHAEIDNLHVSGVSAIESTLRGGRGVAVETIPGFDYQASANVRCSLVEDAREAGVLAIGSSVTAHAVEVRAIRQGLNSYAAGFAHQALIGFEVESAFTATHCEVTDVDGFGLVSIGEHSRIHDSIIDGIQSWPDTELYGDGVAVVSFRIGDVYVHPASADVTGSIVRHSVRAGISSFGGNVTIADDLLDCNAITLNGEYYKDFDVFFDDDGGNVCACGMSDELCKVLTSGLQAPSPIATAP